MKRLLVLVALVLALMPGLASADDPYTYYSYGTYDYSNRYGGGSGFYSYSSSGGVGIGTYSGYDRYGRYSSGTWTDFDMGYSTYSYGSTTRYSSRGLRSNKYSYLWD